MDADALIADLDLDQRAAVTAESQLVAVIAGAGSGKTRVLTRRIAHRIAVGTADPRHTLALTFTRQSAGELRRRLARLGVRERVEAGTFHSVMLAVLKQRWADTNRRALTVVPDRRRLVGDATTSGDRRGIEAFIAEIDWAAARGINPTDYGQAARRAQRRPAPGVERCTEVYEAYEQLKRRRGVIDFDDVLAHVVRDMERNDDFADSIRWRFRHILVDEAQDLNPLQHRLVDLLRKDRNDLFLVGDPSQAIYGFNGADPTLLVDVETRFPGIEIIRLPVNHRCTPQIVRTGVHILSATAQPADLTSNRGDGAGVELFIAADEQSEAQHVADSAVRTDPHLIRAGEVAVLARTNSQLGPLEEALKRAGLPVRRSATAVGSPLQSAVRHVSGLGSASQLRAWAHDTLDTFDELTSARAVQSEVHGDTDTRAVARADRAVAELEAERRVAATLLDYLRDQSRGSGAGFRAWVAMTNPFDDESNKGVELLTFHSSKGREWHTVFVTGVESSLMPHRSATTLETKAEEGRLLYVAATRATDRLVFTAAERRGGYTRSVSPFIADLDMDEPASTSLPSELRKRRRTGDPLLAALKQWRDDAARQADALPKQLCSDRDLNAIARSRPTTPEELEAATTFGAITARRLAPQILPLVELSRSQSKSTMTGA